MRRNSFGFPSIKYWKKQWIWMNYSIIFSHHCTLAHISSVHILVYSNLPQFDVPFWALPLHLPQFFLFSIWCLWIPHNSSMFRPYFPTFPFPNFHPKFVYNMLLGMKVWPKSELYSMKPLAHFDLIKCENIWLLLTVRILPISFNCCCQKCGQIFLNIQIGNHRGECCCIRIMNFLFKMDNYE